MTGRGRQEWPQECVAALAAPPFKVVPVSLQDEARYDFESVLLATGGAETPGLVVFLGSGSQSLCGSGGITALEDGGASHIPTAEAMDNGKKLETAIFWGIIGILYTGYIGIWKRKWKLLFRAWGLGFRDEGFPKLGLLFLGGPYKKDCIILGPTLGSPYFGKLQSFQPYSPP